MPTIWYKYLIDPVRLLISTVHGLHRIYTQSTHMNKYRRNSKIHLPAVKLLCGMKISAP
jgi:hypothetical protein